MARYRKKPIIIEAEQFFEHKVPLPFSPDSVAYFGVDERWYVITIHGQATLIVDGDWIIRETGTRDRAYPCKSDIFEKTYEKICENE